MFGVPEVDDFGAMVARVIFDDVENGSTTTSSYRTPIESHDDAKTKEEDDVEEATSGLKCGGLVSFECDNHNDDDDDEDNNDNDEDNDDNDDDDEDGDGGLNDINGISELELKRMRNVARNIARLASLGLLGCTPSNATPPSDRPNRKKRVVPQDDVERRVQAKRNAKKPTSYRDLS
jgi:hypothetical protein